MSTAIMPLNERTFANPQVSGTDRILMRWFFLSFWAIITTGAIRKWLFPGVSVLYLLQDVPIGLGYLYALWKGRFDRGVLFLGVMLLSALLIFQGMLQIVISGLNYFVAVVGIHNYVFYLPILLVFPAAFTLKYRNDFIRWNLLLSIPMFVLAFAQAVLPKQAWINKTSEGEAFGVPGAEIARVTGTFNFTVFYGVWVGLAVALCMGEWLQRKERRAIQKTWLLILCTITVNLCHLVSGSRSAIALAGMAIVGTVVAAIVLRSTRTLMTVGGLVCFLPIAGAMTYAISPDEFNIVLERFTGERYVADSQDRIRDGIIGWATIPRFDLVGAGIGMGVDASHVGNADTYNFTYELSENDLIRTVMELGSIVGLTYAVTRISFLVGMVFFSVRLVKQGQSPHVLPLAFFLVAQAYQGDLTRAATMTASQVMVGYAFILGTYSNPE